MRYDRLQDLLSEAAEVNDYDVMQAADRVVEYLGSTEGAEVREILVIEAVDVLDKLQTDTVQLLIHQNFLLRSLQHAPAVLFRLLFLDSAPNHPSSAATDASSSWVGGVLTSIFERVVEEIEQQAQPDSSLLSLLKAIKLLRLSSGFNTSRTAALMRKVSIVHVCE
mgnify:CR=1 FL=1